MSFDLEKLPPLAREGHKRGQNTPNLALSVNSVIQDELSEKGLLGNIFNLVFQLIPDREVQYVVLEELECRDDFLRAGLIIETGEGCENTYIVPKEAADCYIEQQ
ncbi:hypothetical protein AB6C54_20635 [Vibrio splendidus]